MRVRAPPWAPGQRHPSPRRIAHRSAQQPAGRVEPHRHRVRVPLDDGALDDAGLGQHDGARRGGIDDAVANALVELAPGRPLAIEQPLPSAGGEPGVEAGGRDAVLPEVVESGIDVVLGEPGPCPLDGIAVHYAVEGCWHAGRVSGGAGRSRTDLLGFAIRCITALLPRHSFLSTKREAWASLRPVWSGRRVSNSRP